MKVGFEVGLSVAERGGGNARLRSTRALARGREARRSDAQLVAAADTAIGRVQAMCKIVDQTRIDIERCRPNQYSADDEWKHHEAREATLDTFLEFIYDENASAGIITSICMACATHK